MRGLTLYEPFASLLCLGVKTIETRSWGTPYRGTLLIHAGREFGPETRELCRRAAVDVIAAAARLTPALRAFANLPWKAKLGRVLCAADLTDCRRMGEAPDPANGEWGTFGPGRWGWVLENVRVLPEPIPWRGSMGLWEVPAELRRLVEKALAEGKRP